MSDLEERFRVLARSRSPDLWEEIRHREPSFPPPERRSGIRIVLAVASALLIVAVSVALLFRAFRTAPQVPAPASESSLNPHIVATVHVGALGQTTSIMYAAGSAWVTTYGGKEQDQYLVRIDPTTNEIGQRIPVVGVPTWETGGVG